MAANEPGKSDPEAALQALREIEQVKLKFESVDHSLPHFGDFIVNAVWLIGDLASDALRRAEGSESDGSLS